MRRSCSTCGQLMDIPESYIGGVMACPKCGVHFTVEAPGEMTSPSGVPATPRWPAAPNRRAVSSLTGTQLEAPGLEAPGLEAPGGYGRSAAVAEGPPATRVGSAKAAAESAQNRPADVTDLDAGNEPAPEIAEVFGQRGASRQAVSAGPRKGASVRAAPARTDNTTTYVLIGGGVLSVAAVLGAMMLAGSSADTAGATGEAEALVRRFLQYAQAKDADKVWPLLSKASQSRFQDEAPKQLEGDRRIFRGDRAGLARHYSMAEWELERFDGQRLLRKLLNRDEPWVALEAPSSRLELTANKADTLTVRLRTSNGGTPTLKLVREGPDWRLDLSPEWH